MPDKRKHRGAHPDDARLFAASELDGLRRAVCDYSWLLSRDYATDSGLKVVGDRYGLTARQRLAVRRCACSDLAKEHRKSIRVEPGCVVGDVVAVDGYNLLITVESALSGGVILIGHDGAYRDVAGVHGTYRKVSETIPALTLIVGRIRSLLPSHVHWYLDSPVSNSGRLMGLLEQIVEEYPASGIGRVKWDFHLIGNPDAALSEHRGIAVTTDSVVLDRCELWFDLAADIVRTAVFGAWVVDLRLPCEDR